MLALRRQAFSSSLSLNSLTRPRRLCCQATHGFLRLACLLPHLISGHQSKNSLSPISQHTARLSQFPPYRSFYRGRL
ncbi:hypothetical protein K469DRAFT_332893 [Zopfia rhizophila CBS 207.26]|uniref:Uncharacterized protein n=1 Tax=Zopfia rhizophila CBS 207.26 TaxID=1314779 RepID=A0A6A6DHM9_9PEZI|nr:hypothetical protein K469DRAFT_332893 [Zopfia rhizophila CBS 207.26]